MSQQMWVYVSDEAKAGVFLRMEGKELIFSKNPKVKKDDSATTFATKEQFIKFRKATEEDLGVKWPEGRLCMVYTAGPAHFEFATQDECRNVGLPSWG